MPPGRFLIVPVVDARRRSILSASHLSSNPSRKYGGSVKPDGLTDPIERDQISSPVFFHLVNLVDGQPAFRRNSRQRFADALSILANELTQHCNDPNRVIFFLRNIYRPWVK